MEFNKATTILSFVGNWEESVWFCWERDNQGAGTIPKIGHNMWRGKDFRSLTRAIEVSEFADSCQKKPRKLKDFEMFYFFFINLSSGD